jgi:membrane protein
MNLMDVGRRGVSLFWDAVNLWLSRYPFQHAGALAFYTLFSLAPLLIILITITGAVLGDDAVRGELSEEIDELIGSQAATAVEDAVERSRIERAGVLPSALGFVALLFGATTVFAQMQSSLNQFWGVEAKPSRSSIVQFLQTRLVSLGLVLIIGFLLLTSFAISTTLAALLRFAEEQIPIPGAAVATLDVAFSLLIATLLFGTIFKVLPDVRLEWGDMWRGAFITALLFVGGQWLISLYLTQTAPESSYGAAGALVLILMWVYYSSLILYFGAALTRATIWKRDGRIVPKPTAVRVKMEILEEQEEGRLTKVQEMD